MTTLPLEDCDLNRHAADFGELVHDLRRRTVLPPDGALDIVGFSFGARVAAAIAAQHPELVRRVVLTGAPADRGPLGRTILKAWLSSLEAGNLEAFVWQSVVDTHSPSFIRQNESKLEGWVASAVRQNRCEAIHALVERSHFEEPNHPQHTLSLLHSAVRQGIKGLIVGGDLDRVAPVEEVERLARELGWPCEILDNAGHSCPIERPAQWRALVGDFLDLK
jgi:pimeloyl-ACP methyl ester carboxylesterase